MIGNPIQKIALVDDDREQQIIFDFSPHGVICLWDEQDCCESRYTSSDDNLSHYEDSHFLGYEIRDAPNVDCEYEYHEVQFFVIKTDRGNITFHNHNEHNGYYGGFYLKAKRLTQTTSSQVRPPS